MRAARVRRGDAQEENRGFSYIKIIIPWTNFASAKFVSRSQLLFLFCSLLAEEELFAPLSVSMDRKWNNNTYRVLYHNKNLNDPKTNLR